MPILLAEESVSQQQYEQVKTAYEATQARYQALLQQKEAAKSQYSETSKKSTGIEANILRKEADLDMAKLNLSYTIVTAPYDGYMGRRTLEPGQFVQAGQTISYLVRGNDKWITANYKETQISHIYIGQKVRIKVDAFREHIFHGTVTAISEATGSKYALVPTDNSAGQLRQSAATHSRSLRAGRRHSRRDEKPPRRHDGRNRSTEKIRKSTDGKTEPSTPPLGTAMAGYRHYVRGDVPYHYAQRNLYGKHAGSQQYPRDTQRRHHNGVLCGSGRYGGSLSHHS